jgi:DNA-binding CsgD family transcriptional regulator
MQQEANTGPSDRPALTEAERSVLAALVAGRTPEEIAASQGVAITTVRTHIMRLHQKFGVNRTLDVVRLALARGALPDRDTPP